MWGGDSGVILCCLEGDRGISRDVRIHDFSLEPHWATIVAVFMKVRDPEQEREAQSGINNKYSLEHLGPTMLMLNRRVLVKETSSYTESHCIGAVVKRVNH